MADPVVIAPVGELDLARVEEFRLEIEREAGKGAGDVIVDLSEVAFIDSTGLSVILRANEQLRRDSRALAVVAPRGTAAAVLLTLAGLRRGLRIFDSRRAALRH